jgi:hypothetical protein
LGEPNNHSQQRVLAEFLARTAVGSSQWIHHAECGLTLDEFQALHALAEEWESMGRVEILETHEESETRRKFTDAIRLRRLT